jgi:2-isopropylmalate synthase
MTPAEKLELARQLEALRVDVIEAGFPISSPGDLESARTVAREIRSATVAGLARANPKDVDAAVDALRPAARPRIHVFIATSPIHMEHVAHDARRGVAAADAAVRRARLYRRRRVLGRGRQPVRRGILCRIFDATIRGRRHGDQRPTRGYTTPPEAVRYSQLRERIPTAIARPGACTATTTSGWLSRTRWRPAGRVR